MEARAVGQAQTTCAPAVVRAMMPARSFWANRLKEINYIHQFHRINRQSACPLPL